jgi:hypothetical protein
MFLAPPPSTATAAAVGGGGTLASSASSSSTSQFHQFLFGSAHQQQNQPQTHQHPLQQQLAQQQPTVINFPSNVLGMECKRSLLRVQKMERTL